MLKKKSRAKHISVLFQTSVPSMKSSKTKDSQTKFNYLISAISTSITKYCLTKKHVFLIDQKYAQTRNRTGGSTMATSNFTTKPFALDELRDGELNPGLPCDKR